MTKLPWKRSWGGFFTSKYWMPKQLGWSKRLVSKCLWFRQQDLAAHLWKLALYTLYMGIYSPWSLLSESTITSCKQWSEAPASHWSELPSTQLTAEIVRVHLMHPPQLSAIRGAPIQSTPSWECKPRTQALALGCRHPHPKQSFNNQLLPRGEMFAYPWEGRQLWPLVSSLTGTVC